MSVIIVRTLLARKSVMGLTSCRKENCMKHLFELFIKLCKNHGFFKSAGLILKMLWYKLRDRRFSQKNADTIRAAVKGKRVVVFTKTIEWNNMFQRSQQLALEFSRRKDTVVIYIERCTTFDFFANINAINTSLFCFTHRHVNKLNDLLKDSKEVILYMTNLLDYDNSMTIRHDKLVYEYIDELEIFFDDIPLAERRHAAALACADVSVATATKLYNHIKDKTKNAILCPNAVDYDFFTGAKSIAVNPEIAPLVKQYKLTIGYYGCLASWFDYDAIFAAAKARPDWLFVMIGIIYDNSTDGHDMEQCPNVLFTGAKPYKELPSYIAGIDILTIPFIINAITESTSPVKLFEYMASGTPILTSMLPECAKYESVHRYTDTADFIVKAEELAQLRNSPEYKALLLKEAKENTWANRVDQVLESLGL